MKKVIFIAGTLAAQLSFAQLYTSGSIVNQTSTPTSNNIGIGVHDPHSNLEVGDQNGGKITISTAGWSGTSVSPKYPMLEFAGYGVTTFEWTQKLSPHALSLRHEKQEEELQFRI